MSYRGRASYNRAPNCASRNTKPYIVTKPEVTTKVVIYYQFSYPISVLL